MLTRIEALRETSKTWWRVYNENLSYKPDSKFAHGCACCQYLVDRGLGLRPDNCMIHCPMIELWPNCCESGGEAYRLWYLTHDKKYALKIAQFADKLIIEEVDGMITRIKFNEIKGQKKNAMVSKEEMVEFLKKEGGTLGERDTKLILMKYWGVEVGDIVISNGVGGCPDRAAEVVHEGKQLRMFKVYAVGEKGMNIDVELRPAKTYSGSLESGIFCFFVDAEISVIKGGL